MEKEYPIPWWSIVLPPLYETMAAARRKMYSTMLAKGKVINKLTTRLFIRDK
jgi:hypothetical protein